MHVVSRSVLGLQSNRTKETFKLHEDLTENWELWNVSTFNEGRQKQKYDAILNGSLFSIDYTCEVRPNEASWVECTQGIQPSK